MTAKLQTFRSASRAQRGAALVIGLILLLVLTLLAVSGMNSASLEFIMAGNEQYRQNAFQSAETGIEVAYATVPFVPGATPPPVTGPVPNSPTDTYSATVTSLANGQPMSPPASPGAVSFGRFSYFNYEIQSTGNTARGGRAVNTLGVSQIGPGP